MIRAHSVSFGRDYVTLNWTHPRFQPERYELSYVCTMKLICTSSHETNRSITTKTQNLSSDITSVRITDIHPGSICMIFLFALYNPASIDFGITITGTTVDEDAANIDSGLKYFTKAFLIMFLVIHGNMVKRMCIHACM